MDRLRTVLSSTIDAHVFSKVDFEKKKKIEFCSYLQFHKIDFHINPT